MYNKQIFGQSAIRKAFTCTFFRIDNASKYLRFEDRHEFPVVGERFLVDWEIYFIIIGKRKRTFNREVKKYIVNVKFIRIKLRIILSFDSIFLSQVLQIFVYSICRD